MVGAFRRRLWVMSDSLGDQCCQSIFPCVLDLPEYYVAHGLGSLLLTLTISLARPVKGVKKGVGTEEQRKRKRNGSRSTRTFFFLPLFVCSPFGPFLCFIVPYIRFFHLFKVVLNRLFLFLPLGLPFPFSLSFAFPYLLFPLFLCVYTTWRKVELMTEGKGSKGMGQSPLIFYFLKRV